MLLSCDVEFNYLMNPLCVLACIEKDLGSPCFAVPFPVSVCVCLSNIIFVFSISWGKASCYFVSCTRISSALPLNMEWDIFCFSGAP